MYVYEAHRDVPASCNETWKLLAQVSDWPSWLPTVRWIQPLDSNTLSCGARFRISQPRLLPCVWKVTQLDPARRFTWETRSPGLRIIADHILSNAEPGACRILLRITVDGVLGGLFAFLLGNLVQENLAQEAKAVQLVLTGSARLRADALADVRPM